MGPRKYDDRCTYVREQAGVIDGAVDRTNQSHDHRPLPHHQSLDRQPAANAGRFPDYPAPVIRETETTQR
jgi:hypothetical protein